MLARHLRAALRPTCRSTAFATRATFTSFANHKSQQIPVVSYEGGHRHEELLEAPSPSIPGPVSPASQDEHKTAHPFNAIAYEHLTPTLSRFTLRDKVAVVTGGGRGLGLNMAQALAEVGVRGIAILDVQQEVGDKSARELSEQTGVDVRFYRVDVRDGQGIGQTIQDIHNHYGALDVLINAAGIADSNIKAETYDPEKFRRLLDINITGTFLVAQACGQHMIRSGTGGSIINIASMSGSIVNYPQEQSCYNASKAAVIQLTKSLAAE